MKPLQERKSQSEPHGSIMLSVDTQRIVTALDFLDEVDRKTESEQVEVINLTARETELRTVNRASAELTVPASYIRQHIRTVKLATAGNMEAQVRASEKQTNLTRFKHTPTDDGVVVERRRGRIDNIEGAFIFTSRSGTPLIGLSKKRLRTKFPRVKVRGGSSTIQALYGPTPNQVFFSKGPPTAREVMDEQTVNFLEAALS